MQETHSAGDLTAVGWVIRGIVFSKDQTCYVWLLSVCLIFRRHLLFLFPFRWYRMHEQEQTDNSLTPVSWKNDPAFPF